MILEEAGWSYGPEVCPECGYKSSKKTNRLKPIVCIQCGDQQKNKEDKEYKPFWLFVTRKNDEKSDIGWIQDQKFYDQAKKQNNLIGVCNECVHEKMYQEEPPTAHTYIFGSERDKYLVMNEECGFKTIDWKIANDYIKVSELKKFNEAF